MFFANLLIGHLQCNAALINNPSLEDNLSSKMQSYHTWPIRKIMILLVFLASLTSEKVITLILTSEKVITHIDLREGQRRLSLLMTSKKVRKGYYSYWLKNVREGQRRLSLLFTSEKVIRNLIMGRSNKVLQTSTIASCMLNWVSQQSSHSSWTLHTYLKLQ